MAALTPRLVTTSPLEADADWLITFVCEKAPGDATLQAIDAAVGGGLTQLRERDDLKGKVGELTLLPVAPGLKAQRLLIGGLGPAEKLTLARWEQVLLTSLRKASSGQPARVALAVPEAVCSQLGEAACLQLMSQCCVVGGVSQALYRTESDRHPFTQAELLHPSASETGSAAVERGRVLGEAMNLVRELVNRHPEDIVPTTFVARAVEEAHAAGLETEVFDLARLEDERMGALLAVARGSIHEPRVLVLRHRAGGDAPALALCGKGVTFDSGGLSIKPSPSMLTMKGDMAGAATVLGTLIAAARLQLPVNLLGVVGLVENMIGPHSFKLGEVLTARNGVTIEVQNTDAEGRLVLADVLDYAVSQKPARLVDLATLTGSCVVALGEEIAGAFGNDESWEDLVSSAAQAAGEDIWPLPMHDSFDEQLKSDFADIRNIGGKWGGATTAAKFLERFVGDVPWVHLDIAGPAYAESGKPYRDVGATGFGVRTLIELARQFITLAERGDLKSVAKTESK